MINLDYLLLSLKTDNEVSVGPSEICSYLSSEYNRRFPKRPPDNNSVNNTNNDGKSHAYFYPRVQYKVIRGGPIIAAVNEGCELLWSLYDKLDQLNAVQPDWKIVEKRLIDRKAPMGLTRDFIKYRFLTPWLSLPEEAFKKYLLMDEEARQKMVIKSLEGHIKSIAESLGCPLDGELRIKMNIKANYIFQREIHVAGLFGSFLANFEMPNFLGIGKSVSRGFGTIKQL
ncbi:MAG: hypothetical protein A2W25_01260 [candidate division Zixibacteria bacterium RBG_16_53_22]|nr:MAG: hypothetical protein A2W25_01260 [candidate division Zixibacteria bacterium RBG_16_53_22]